MKYEEVIEEIKDSTNFSKEKTIIVRSSNNNNIINSHKTEIYEKKNKWRSIFWKRYLSIYIKINIGTLYKQIISLFLFPYVLKF